MISQTFNLKSLHPRLYTCGGFSKQEDVRGGKGHRGITRLISSPCGLEYGLHLGLWGVQGIWPTTANTWVAA